MPLNEENKPNQSFVSDLKLRKFFRKNQNGFQRKQSTNFSDSDYSFNHWRNMGKKSQSNTIVCRFLQDFIYGGKIEILLAYGFPKETVTAIIMLYKETKVIVCSPDNDSNYFDIGHWNLVRRYISTVFIYNLPRLHPMNISRSNEKKVSY